MTGFDKTRAGVNMAGFRRDGHKWFTIVILVKRICTTKVFP